MTDKTPDPWPRPVPGPVPDLAPDPAEAEALRAIRSALNDGPPGESGLSRLKRTVEEEAAAAQRDPTRFWQYAAGLVAAALLGLSLMTFLGGEPDFHLAGGGTAGPGLVVRFEPDATAGRIEALLTELRLTIAAGPSAAGLWFIAPLDGADLGAAAAGLTASGLAEQVARVDSPP